MERTDNNVKIVEVKSHKDCDYTLVIPEELENKIRFACREVWSREWSGILFYTYEGTFEGGDLKILCKDMYIMDIGSATTTEFGNSPDVVAYMCEKELLGCQMGLIHSHNLMATFFSGEDVNTLKQEGTDSNNFVSLIVNNRGDYSAAVTRRVKSTRVIKKKTIGFFGEPDKTEIDEYVDDTKTIEYFKLRVVVENRYKSSEIESRLVELRNKVVVDLPNKTEVFGQYYGQKIQKDKETDYQEDPSVNTLSVDKDAIKEMVLQIVTGSILMTTKSKIDPSRWSGAMTALYTERFGAGKEALKRFDEWAKAYLEYLMWSIEDDDLEGKGLDITEVASVYASHAIHELKKLPSNIYIERYIKFLKDYIV
jgi:proteasome lid subunit RPN8/RPN11